MARHLFQALTQLRLSAHHIGYLIPVFIVLIAFAFNAAITTKIALVSGSDRNTFASEILADPQFEADTRRFLTAVAGAITPASSASRSDAIDRVGTTFDTYARRIDIILADLNAADLVKSDGLPSDLDLSAIQANLEKLRTVIANSAGQDVDYFRQILNVANAGLVDLWRETLAHPRAFTPEPVMADSKAPAPQPSLLTPLRRLEALLVLVAILISWITWKYNQQTVSLAHINSKLDKAIETSLDAVIITDAQGKVTTYNIAAEEMFGLTFSNVEGAFVEDLLTSGSLKFEKRKLSGRQISASLARSANRGRMRLKLQRNDGVCIMVEVAVISDKDSNGQLIYIAFLRDISKLVQSDLAERAARREAERSSAANARFLAVMSHEMRTPLHGIMTALELMEDTETEDKKVLLRQIARNCAGSALEQIEEVLELSLHDVPDVPDVFLTFFPVEVARLIVEQSQSLAGVNQTTLTLACDPQVSEPLLGNRRAFRSALSNLIGNAIKFTKSGEILVELYPTPDVAGSMRVQVTDTGIGIEPKNLKRISNDFETVSVLSSQAFGSSGLGLGIVNRAVAMMGGHLEYISKFGKGSQFWFDIPLPSSLLGTAQMSETDQSDHADTGLSLLVVDDIPINRLLLSQMLERLGHIVEVADDGAVAVDIARKKRFDLILMDINMPGMNGVDATRKIREGGASANVPIMGVTANAQPHELALFKDAGLDLTLVKPITSTALALKVKELRRLQIKTGSSYETRELTSLVAKEIIDDLKSAMSVQDLQDITKEALHDAGSALVAASAVTQSETIAEQIHKAAGPIAMIGAIRLHRLLCELENATRADDTIMLKTLLHQAIATKHETDLWFEENLISIKQLH